MTRRLDLGKYLKRLRIAKSVSLRDVEREIGIPNSYLSQLENGNKFSLPCSNYLNRLADYFDVTVETLLIKAGYLIDAKSEIKSGQKLRMLQINLKNLHNKAAVLERELKFLLDGFDE